MRRLLALVCAVLAVALVAPGVSTAEPATAEQRLAWFASASARVPVSEEELRATLTPEAYEGVGGAAGFNEVLAGTGSLETRWVSRATPTEVVAVLSDWVVTLAVDARGLVSTLLLRPYDPGPISWSEMDSRLRTLAPEVAFAVSEEDCTPVHEVRAAEAMPLGSAVKLYILSALGRRIAAGEASWDDVLPIREAWKSLPTGVLQDEPAGTPVTLRRHAELMISISDNTATDHLLHFVGRPAVAREMARLGNDRAANRPLLSTRELFALKGFRYPSLADTYLSLPRGLRAAVLPVLAAVPRTAIQPWTEPRHTDTIEWFGSPRDLCRATTELLTQGDPVTAGAMSISDGGIALDPAEFPTVWYKGGSEPGMLVLNYLVRTADDRTLVATVQLSDPDGELPPETAAEAQALVRGALTLASGVR